MMLFPPLFELNEKSCQQCLFECLRFLLKNDNFGVKYVLSNTLTPNNDFK
jgi:hypothetical protein